MYFYLFIAILRAKILCVTWALQKHFPHLALFKQDKDLENASHEENACVNGQCTHTLEYGF